ncbi:TonB-dependent receptor domain-containing protein [Novosphingobium sp. KA1]|uniref:TonB-dependent receptor domain-containing protein n=1 Tax=Novosphingobium sp. (strain KA1) TaxID=164608 RepID=UPI001A8F846B|nr:TonB-dependent receptor [Novosphingobium sp. KA1]QSR20334.1 TonB-dependent receptor [Novosphingobium sp. KA1]
MRDYNRKFRQLLTGGTAALGVTIALAQPAMAQDSVQNSASADEASDAGSAIFVTGSRIDRKGFDAPTPTTVVGETELRLGARPSIAQVLNDLPQFRATQTPASTVANTNSSASAMDLRGLGVTRTLTLLNNRRFTGSADLNTIPQGLVKRVDVVTGGASAAWGSGAIGGVVNIILDDELEGVTLGAQNGISSRGDGYRYSFDGTFGTKFAGGRGHFMIGAEYQHDEGILDRNSRKNVGSSNLFSPVGGDHAYILVRDVNASNTSLGGLITSGSLAGQTFNSDGTLRDFQYGSQISGTTMVGGEGVATNDEYALTNPYQRVNSYARASFEVGDATFWADGSYSRIWASYPFYAESGTYTISAANPYLSDTIRSQLAAAGETSIKVGRVFEDYGYRNFDYYRQNVEGAIGVDGSFADGKWRYSAYYSHGEMRNMQSYHNQITGTNLTNALDAVTDSSGNIVCRVALTDPDTACAPLNILGTGTASQAAIDYVFGNTARAVYTTKLDSMGGSLRGDPFSTWAGPVSIAVGAEARWEEQVTSGLDAVSAAKGFSRFNFSPLNGGFNVQEFFGEVAVPLLDQPFSKLDVNGAARYSHYSTSGGIWSWKLGLTDRIFNNLLLRVSRSRDIRSGSLSELFTTTTTSFSTVAENGNTYSVTRYGGGNADLKPEIGSTLTLGAVFTPSFLPGFNLSVDYYNIKLRDAITSLGAQDIVSGCDNGNTSLCSQIVRDGSGAPTTIYTTYINLAEYKTKGIDIEGTYQFPLSTIAANLGGNLRLRGLATYVPKVLINDGTTTVDRAGDVGDNVSFGTPHWRASGIVTYTSDTFSLDTRVRYVGGGKFNHALDIANNDISARVYVDLGAQVNIDKFTLFANVNNLFDRDPPLTTYGAIHYDTIGRYFTMGAKVRF